MPGLPHLAGTVSAVRGLWRRPQRPGTRRTIVSSSPRLDDSPNRRSYGVGQATQPTPVDPFESCGRPPRGAAPRRHPTRLQSALRKGSFPLASRRVSTPVQTVLTES